GPFGCADSDAAAKAVAAVGTDPAGTADRQVVGDRGIAERDGSAVRAVINRPAAYGETAAPPATAGGAGATSASARFIGKEGDPGNGPARERVHRPAAA